MTAGATQVAVPFELTRRDRNRWGRHRCTVCDKQLAGGRAVASTIDPDALYGAGDPEAPTRPAWVIHHACYLQLFRRALLSAPGMVDAPTEEAAHHAFRAALTRTLGRKLAATQGIALPGEVARSSLHLPGT